MRERIGNILRYWADKIEGGPSYVMRAYGSPTLTLADVNEALTLGINEATAHLNDLARERGGIVQIGVVSPPVVGAE